jgi:hypothetical protein
MEKRLKFRFGEQKTFINQVFKKSKLSINDLAKLVDVHPRSLRDWKREKLTMSLKAAEIFCKFCGITLPEEKEILIQRWQFNKIKAARIGGIVRYKKYGEFATEEGRRKGGIKAIVNLRKHKLTPKYKIYNFPKYFSEDLAEFVGIMLGDGGITSSQCTITLNSIVDLEYSKYVVNLCLGLFGELPRVFKKKDCNAIVLYYNGSMLIRYLCSIGLKTGNKVKQQVGVPNWITENNAYRKACLRGLIDTDGGVFIHKYKVKGKEYSYKKICFSNRSNPLLFFVKETLLRFGFTPKTIDKVANKKVWLYNEGQVNHYLASVRSHNFRLNKFIGR